MFIIIIKQAGLELLRADRIWSSWAAQHVNSSWWITWLLVIGNILMMDPREGALPWFLYAGVTWFRGLKPHPLIITTRNVEFTESRYPQNMHRYNYPNISVRIFHCRVSGIRIFFRVYSSSKVSWTRIFGDELSWYSLFLSFLVHSGYIPKLEIGYISSLRIFNISGGECALASKVWPFRKANSRKSGQKGPQNVWFRRLSKIFTVEVSKTCIFKEWNFKCEQKRTLL